MRKIACSRSPLLLMFTSVVVIWGLLSTAMAASPVTPTRDSLSAEVARQLNQLITGTDQIDTTKMYGALNQALVAVCRDFPALEKMDTLTIAKDSEGVALATDFLRLKAVFRMKGDTLRLPLKITVIDSLPYRGDSAVDVQVKDNILSPRWAYSWGGRLLTYPKYILPSTPDSFLVYYYALDDKLTTGTDSVSIDKTYLPALKYYACYTLSAIRHDFEAATYWLGLYDKEVNSVGKARELELRK